MSKANTANEMSKVSEANDDNTISIFPYTFELHPTTHKPSGRAGGYLRIGPNDGCVINKYKYVNLSEGGCSA